MSVSAAISIPLLNNETERIVLYRDELPVVDDLIDALRAEFAPLDVWRKCALEYYRQGFTDEFGVIIAEIVDSLQDPIVEEAYSQKEKNLEHKAELFNALAARVLNVAQNTPADKVTAEHNQKIVEYLKKSESLVSLNEYTWLIKGFYQLYQGEANQAESLFKMVQDRSKNKKCLFGSSLGLASVLFMKEKFDLSLTQLQKAIEYNPDCSANVKVAFAVCCYKLNQFERSKLALLKAIDMEADNADALILLSMIEQLESRKQKTIKDQSNQLPLDLATIAIAVNQQHAAAHFQMANSLFYQGKIMNCRIVNSTTIQLPLTEKLELSVYDIIEFDNDTRIYLVSSIEHRQETFIDGNESYELSSMYICLNHPIHKSEGKLSCKIKELEKAKQYVHAAISYTTNNKLISECYYLLGRVSHSQGLVDEAFDYYRHSLKASADNSLSQFEAAKYLFSSSDYSSALELFERILKKYPDDKDTLGFIYLIKSIKDGEKIPIEKLRDVAPKFQFESDLWLIQAVIRQKDPNEYRTSLRCYHSAFDAMKLAGKSINWLLYCNMAALLHGLGQLPAALETLTKAIKDKYGNLHFDSLHSSPFFSSELEDIFYSWQPLSFKFVVMDDMEGHFKVEDGTDLRHILELHDEIVFNGVRGIIVNIDADTFQVKSPLLDTIEQGAALRFAKKVKIFDISDDNLSVCFDLARILEDCNKTKAAVEIYTEILKFHPGYMECYLRLSEISKGLGKMNDAFVWLSRASGVEDAQSDMLVLHGDLSMRNNKFEDAKRSYEKVISKNNKDLRAVMALGNLYFSSSANKQDPNTKDSQKFFYSALNEDKRNPFAACGIGMVCAVKGKLDAAKDIFSRIREVTACPDIIGNLANVNLAQRRFNDAENLYNSALKACYRASSTHKLAYLHDSLAHSQSQHGRIDDSIKTLLRLLHHQPNTPLLWYKLAILVKKKLSYSKRQLMEIELVDVLQQSNFAFVVLKFVLAVTSERSINKDTLKSQMDSLKKFQKELTNSSEIHKRKSEVDPSSEVKKQRI